MKTKILTDFQICISVPLKRKSAKDLKKISGFEGEKCSSREKDRKFKYKM